MGGAERIRSGSPWPGRTGRATTGHAGVDAEAHGALGCLALQRAGLPGNETPTYVVHYMCDDYWAGLYGSDRVPEMRVEASALAADLLAWAQGWGAAHRE